MDKLILMSALVTPFLIGLRAARARSPRRGLRRTILLFCLHNVAYIVAVLLLLGRQG